MQPEDTGLTFHVQGAAPQPAALAGPPRPAQLIDLINHEYYGTEGPDTFTAPTNDNWYLSGQGGNDDLRGAGGNDIIFGGAGNDFLAGGLGNDSFYVESAGDFVAESAGSGSDRVYASADYVLFAGQSIEILSTDSSAGTAAINLGGNELANIIYGNAGNNILYGKGGDDWLEGLGGNDQYYVDSAGDYVREVAGGGFDRILAGGDYTLYAGQSIEILSTDFNAGTAPIALGGNELANIIYGNAGNNILYGKGGDDFIGGLAGDDSYFIDSAGDYVQEFAGEGNDRIYAGGDYTLYAGQHIEILSTDFNAGTAALALGGNELANTIYGNAGNNLIYGQGGADTMAGFEGDDQYYVDQAGDSVYESAGGGNDRVLASASFQLGAGQSIETLSTDFNAGTTAINLTGNELANSIYGNAGVNVLDGKGGNDTLIGGAGADSFAFTAALGAGNVDTVVDFATGSDKISLGGGSGEPFAQLASGALAAGAFVIGTQALQADDYIIYNSTTGALSYDADGNGAGAAVQFATLGTGLSLTAADFIVSGPANNAPAVTSGSTATVVENTAASTVVYTATATDANGDRITWSLGGTDAGQLSIDAVTGQVRLLSPSDFETKTSYSFTVIASDSGTTAGVQSVTLSVTDVSDTPATPIINEVSTPNNGISTAQVIDRNTLAVATNPDLPNQTLPSGTITGSVSVNSDVDYFAITLQAGEQLILDVDHTSGGLDAVVRVYNTAGTELGYNDDQVSFDQGSVPTIASHNTDSYVTFRATTAGTYYFSIESYGDGIDNGPGTGTSSGNYNLNVSIGPAATQAQIIEEDINALISGSQWNTTSLRYGFPTAAGDYPASMDEPDNNFEAFNPQQQAVVTAQMALISQVSGLVFTLETVNFGAAHLRYAMSDEADVAYAYYPPSNGQPGGVGGSAWFNNTDADFDNPRLGNYGWMGILHETGHALGLKHGHEFPAISGDRDSVEYSVMTYRSYPGQSLAGGGGYTNEAWGYPQSLMMYDIAALQRIYGANFATNNTNTVYTFSSTTGEMSLNGVGQGAPGDGNGVTSPNENRIFRTIWDGGGTDTYDLSNYTTNMTIDLRPGEWSTFSTSQLANLGGPGPTFARGNVANALMYQGNTASLIENAIGGSGADTLYANQVANQLRGNGGADTFKWTAGTLGNGAFTDTILDFASGDKIDLSGVDANSGTGADDAFAFIGSGAFTNVAGQLRYENGHIFGDVDGNGTADFDIVVTNAPALVSTDFIL